MSRWRERRPPKPTVHPINIASKLLARLSPPQGPPPPDFSVGANTLCVMFVVGLVFVFLSSVFFNIEIRGGGGFGPRPGLHEGAKSLAILIGSTVRGFLPKLTFSKK